jgi:hypothetical protein
MTSQISAPYKAFLIIFGAILLCLQVFNYLYVRNLDRKYSELLSNKMEALISFQVIAHESSDIQRALRSLTISELKDSTKWRKEIRESDRKIRDKFNLLNKSAASDSEKMLISNFKDLYTSYKFKVDSFSSLLYKHPINDTSLASTFGNVRVMYEDYMNSEDQNTAYFRDKALQTSEKITKDTEHATNLMLFVGTLPFLILACGLIISLVVILWLGSSMRWLKRTE